MARSQFRASREIIVLSDSESDDEGPARRELGHGDALPQAVFVHNRPGAVEAVAEPNAMFLPIDPELIDLADIPDIDVPPSDPVKREDDGLQPVGQARMITESECLQMVLGVLPDISVEYVLKRIREKTTNCTRTTATCEHLLTELLEGDPYPKEANEKKRKRHDEAEHELSDYEKGERDPEISGYERDA